MRKSELEKYARLIARKGVNVQPGQLVTVNANVQDAEFARMVVRNVMQPVLPRSMWTGRMMK